jgi:acylphosphatase
MRTVELLVSGRVQGVGYRACVKRVADSLIIMGEVMNLADGRVRIVATAEDVILEKFISMLYGCPRAIVREVRTIDSESRAFPEFCILKGLF